MVIGPWMVLLQIWNSDFTNILNSNIFKLLSITLHLHIKYLPIIISMLNIPLLKFLSWKYPSNMFSGVDHTGGQVLWSFYAKGQTAFQGKRFDWLGSKFT